MGKKILCHNFKNEEFLVEADKFKFRPSAYGLLIKEGKILLSPQRDGYDFPGGGINIDETVEEALRREFWEETGLKIEVDGVLKVISSFYAPRLKIGQEEQEYWNCQAVYFLVHQVGGELSTVNLDEDEKIYLSLAEWVAFENVPKLKFHNRLGNVGSTALISSQF